MEASEYNCIWYMVMPLGPEGALKESIVFSFDDLACSVCQVHVKIMKLIEEEKISTSVEAAACVKVDKSSSTIANQIPSELCMSPRKPSYHISIIAYVLPFQ